MTVDLAILIPVLRRPHNIRPLVDSIVANTKEPYELLFIACPDDEDEIAELKAQNQLYGIMNASFVGKGDYARKINAGFDAIEANWYFTGADDLRFHPNWFEEAMVVHEKTGACVIGTNDLGSPVVMRGQHATHSLVLGEYVEECGTIDEQGKIFHEGYCHNFVDSELTATAQWRGAWAFAKDSIVAHNHPDWGKASMDEVYKIGKNSFHIDQQYFEKRKRLWKDSI